MPDQATMAPRHPAARTSPAQLIAEMDAQQLCRSCHPASAQHVLATYVDGMRQGTRWGIGRPLSGDLLPCRQTRNPVGKEQQWPAREVRQGVVRLRG